MGRPPAYDWTRVEDRLGTVPDRVLAAELGCSSNADLAARHKRGIPAYRASSRPPALTPALLAMLGRHSDGAVAALAGCCVPYVQRQRVKRGIAAYPGPGGRPESPFPAAAIPLLGTMPDAEVARRVGVHHQRIYMERTRRGIPACGHRSVIPPELLARLGTAPDRELAALAGCCKATVVAARLAAGIPPFGRRQAAPRHQFPSTGQELRAWRETRGLTRAAVAEALHIPEKTLKNWEQPPGTAGHRSMPSWMSHWLPLMLAHAGL